MNVQQEKSVVLTEMEFVETLTMFQADERAALLARIDEGG